MQRSGRTTGTHLPAYCPKGSSVTAMMTVSALTADGTITALSSFSVAVIASVRSRATCRSRSTMQRSPAVGVQEHFNLYIFVRGSESTSTSCEKDSHAM